MAGIRTTGHRNWMAITLFPSQVILSLCLPINFSDTLFPNNYLISEILSLKFCFILEKNASDLQNMGSIELIDNKLLFDSRINKKKVDNQVLTN